MKCIVLTTLTIPLLAKAGEILLYNKNGCGSSYYDIFGALGTTGCQTLALSFGDPQIYNLASSSRTIGPACTFDFYADAKCSKLTASLSSTANPKKTCITRDAGFKSCKITCKKPARLAKRDEDWFGGEDVFGDEDWFDSDVEVGHGEDEVKGRVSTLNVGSDIEPTAELRRRTETSPRISGGTSYFGPGVPYKNKPSGRTEVFANLLIRSGVTSPRPPGSSSAAGIAIAAAFYKLTPPGVQTFRPSVNSGGVKYTVQLDGYRETNVQETLRFLGQAAFASMMADTVALVQGQPQTWWTFDIVDSTNGDVYRGNVNITYTIL